MHIYLHCMDAEFSVFYGVDQCYAKCNTRMPNVIFGQCFRMKAVVELFSKELVRRQINASHALKFSKGIIR